MRSRDYPTRRSLVRALRRRRSLRAGLTQLLYVVAGVGLALLLAPMDVGPAVPTAEVVSLLAGITAGLLALIGIVFALLLLVVQFAATAQSPRLHLFRDNPLVWNVLGLLIGIMVYATTCFVVVSRQPTSSVLLPISAIVLVLLAVALTRRLQLDALRSVQLASALADVSARTREVIDRLYTAPFPQPAAPPVAAPEQTVLVRWPADYGVVLQIDLPRLLLLAGQAGATVRLRAMPGDVVQEGAVVLEIWDPATPPDAHHFLGALEVGLDRTFTQDPLFGFRLLNDFALRALSPAVNDPASAVEAIDAIESLLLRLATRDLAIGSIADATDTVRVVFDAIDWEGFLVAGVDEIAQTAMHPMVRRRLRVMLDRIRDVAQPERHPQVDRRIAGLG